jgi:quercetin dioxygenase-like cupin family protein
MHVTRPTDAVEMVLGATRVRFVVPASATGGAYEVMEFRGQPGGPGPRAHYHKRADEAFIVLEGALEMEVGGEKVFAPAGTSVHVPRGTVHVFRYAAADTRMIAVLTPATRFEEYVPKLQRLLAEGGGAMDAGKLAAVMAEHDAFVG